MSIFGARVPITTAIGYQVAVMPAAGWKRLSELVTIPPDSTGALIYAIGADIPWMQAPDSIPSYPTGLSLAAGNYLTLDDATQVSQFCLNTDWGGSLAVQFFTGPVGKLPKITAPGGGGGGGTGVQSVTGIDVNNTDPLNPIVEPPSVPTKGVIWVAPFRMEPMHYDSAPYDMMRPYPTLAAAYAVQNYAAGDVIALLPGQHQAPSSLGNIRLRLIGATLGAPPDVIQLDTGVIVEIEGSGTVNCCIWNNTSTLISSCDIGDLVHNGGSTLIRGNLLGVMIAETGTIHVTGSILGQPNSIMPQESVVFSGAMDAVIVVDGDVSNKLDCASFGIMGPNSSITVNGTVWLYDGKDMYYDGLVDLNNVRIDGGTSTVPIAYLTGSARLNIRGRAESPDGVPVFVGMDASSTRIYLMGGSYILNGHSTTLASLLGTGAMSIFSLGSYVAVGADPGIPVNGALNIESWLD